jgi:hypothetical protein
MQGRVFMGPEARPERDYIFASRDRRFKYIRHDYLREPYLLWIPYRNRHPIVRELWDGYRAGTLNRDQLALFGDRPAEELYDTATDPYELHNLAANPAHRTTLERLRAATVEWTREVGDLGEIAESEMVRRWYPDGKQPVTAAPICVPIAEGEYATRAIEEADLTGPALLQLQTATQGASIGYRFADDPEDRWRLYTAPIPLLAGEHRISAKAIRIGYEESEAVGVTVRVR